MGRSKTILISATLVLAALGTGCGGGGTDSISKPAFIKKADAICAEGDKRTQEEFTTYAKEKKIRSGSTPSSVQLVDITRSILIPALEQQTQEIKALGAPAGDENQINTFLKRVDEAIKAAEKKPIAAVKSPQKLLAHADQAISDYGFQVCGSNN